jgi:hypothetical protein
MFGWHVHEKAVLLILVPLRCVDASGVSVPGSLITGPSLLAGDSHALFRTYLIASVAGIYGLFPLLFTPAGEVIWPACIAVELIIGHRNLCQDRILSGLGCPLPAASQSSHIRVSIILRYFNSR